MYLERSSWPRVLIVDDDAAIRRLLEDMCEAEGFAADAAAEPQEALRLVGQRRYDLVLLDEGLAGCSGIEVLAGLRIGGLDEGIPVIVVSGTERLNEATARGLGVVDFVRKPFRVFDLLQRMRQALRILKRESEPPSLSPERQRQRLARGLLFLPTPRQLRSHLSRSVVEARRHGRSLCCVVLQVEGNPEQAEGGGLLLDALLGLCAFGAQGRAAGGVYRSDADELCWLAEPLGGEAWGAWGAQVEESARFLWSGPRPRFELRMGVAQAGGRGAVEPEVLLAAARGAAQEARRQGVFFAIEPVCPGG